MSTSSVVSIFSVGKHEPHGQHLGILLLCWWLTVLQGLSKAQRLFSSSCFRVPGCGTSRFAGHAEAA